MNYYEELGIRPDASEDEIRKAHRRLVKLMHPDQQREPGLKLMAETQMRRLNSIASTLLDGEQRRQYDDRLRVASEPAAVPRLAWRGIPWWVGSTVGAVVLALAGVWFLADRLGSNFSGRNSASLPIQDTTSSVAVAEPAPANQLAPEDPTQTAGRAPSTTQAAPTNAPPGGPLPSSTTSSSSTKQAMAAPAKVQPAPARIDSESRPARSTVAHSASSAPSIRPLAKSKAKPATAVLLSKAQTSKLPPPRQVDGRKPFSLPASAMAVTIDKNATRTALPPAPRLAPSAPREEVGTLAMPALPAAIAPRPDLQPVHTSAPLARLDPLEGEWVYAPKEPEKHKPGFYPPAFIRLKLFSVPGGDLRGQYSARYEVTDKPISPDVAFQLAAVDKASHKFVWQSTNGSRGTLAIRPLDDKTIRLEWRTTIYARAPALTSGTATLVRRSD